MTSTSSAATGGVYRIGKVSRLTGISPDTLRIWERRYEAVTPERTSAGGRLYSPHDIARLKLMKQLVDGGDSISDIAQLSITELEARAQETGYASAIEPMQGPIRVIIIGDTLPARLIDDEVAARQLDVISTFTSIQDFEVNATDARADVLIIEQATLHADTVYSLPDWLNRTQAAHAVVLYRFASRDALSRLPKARCSTLRSPVEPGAIGNHCAAVMKLSSACQAEAYEPAVTAQVPPARKYDDATLVKIASLSPAIKCECPRHLAELLSSLVAFEQYSNECESRNQNDAELHAYLAVSTSQARHIIENALDVLIEAENIQL